MDHRDDWPDGILEGDLDAVAERDPTERISAERMARDSHNMNAVLSAMADQVSEGVPTPIHGQRDRGPQRAHRRSGKITPAPRRHTRKWHTVAPLAAAAAIAALILVRGGETGDGGEPLPPPESRMPSMVSEMDVEADRPFAVFPTSNPDIAVVWLLNPKEKTDD
ncbi:MAG: hypothetical protein F4139_16180 [Gemmatimonadetes bacterium]|nr:hypothetical protein [Gemmatimonadota bacterium]MYA63810.1 hypothetical protein [Gemmatimonadota bacterium]MYB97473.1 hypothetical protein [Gemmatimonadota bacterium]MYH54453.1 hypothetical protein [Gemmatimonadota bacterium]MYI45131.1 hypothetical protein [Gemmatimonadota bacterium]